MSSNPSLTGTAGPIIKTQHLLLFFHTFSIKRLRKLVCFIPEMSENWMFQVMEKNVDQGIRL